jgi:hypothetical protein
MDVLVNDYVSTGDMEHVLVVTALNRNRCEINNRMREELKDQGEARGRTHVPRAGAEKLEPHRTPNRATLPERRCLDPEQMGTGLRVGAQGIVTGADDREQRSPSICACATQSPVMVEVCLDRALLSIRPRDP